MLKLNHIEKTYNQGTVTVIRGVTGEFSKGSIVGLAGPSGGGKSTLLRIIQGLEKPDRGSVEWTGKKGFMFQDFQLFPHMTVERNLSYAPLIHGHNREHVAQKLMKLLEKLGLMDKAKNYPHQLSGGQKQRVALARTLMMDPDLLLCDEPTSGLDVATIQDVVTLLQSIVRPEMTIILASHDLDFLTRIASRILVLRNGEIVADVLPQHCQNDKIIPYLKTFYNQY